MTVKNTHSAASFSRLRYIRLSGIPYFAAKIFLPDGAGLVKPFKEIRFLSKADSGYFKDKYGSIGADYPDKILRRKAERPNRSSKKNPD